MKPISIQLYTVRELAKQDFLAVLRLIASIGYKGVEPAGLHGHKPADIRKVLDDLGMVCSSTHGPLVTAENVTEAVDTAMALGYDKLIAGWKSREDWASMDGVKRAAEGYRKACELLKPHGLKMGYHNHWWEMPSVDGKPAPYRQTRPSSVRWEMPSVDGKPTLERFYELCPEAFAQIDVYWASNFGQVDVPALVKRLALRTPLLHIKDGPLVQGQPHTAAGAGKMDLPACVAAADEKTLQWIVVELDECATDMLTAVRQSYDYLVTKAHLAQGNK